MSKRLTTNKHQEMLLSIAVQRAAPDPGDHHLDRRLATNRNLDDSQLGRAQNQSEQP
jgi:hypothetical protein